MSAVLEKIKEHGNWHVIIRPETFIQERIDLLSLCEELVEKHQVRHRGWYFPHTDASRLQRGLDYIELETDCPPHPEAWRFYQSGQFVFWSALGEDHLEHYPFQGTGREVQPGEWLRVLSSLFRLSEVYEFAARLAQQGVLGDQLCLRVELNGTKGRVMEFSTPDRSMGMNCTCIEESLPRERVFRTSEFIPKARELALQHFIWLSERFQCKALEHVFRRDQERFFEGRY